MKQKLMAIFLMGVFLLNYPVLSLFSRQHWVVKIPVLYLYLFTVWLILIGLAYWVIERHEKHRSPTSEAPANVLQKLEKSK